MSNSKGPKPPSSQKPGKSQKTVKGKLGHKPRSIKVVEKKFAFQTDDSPRLNQPRKEKIEQPLDNMRMGELVIDRMSHDGRGIAYWQNKTCFVEAALTGEKVTARLVQNHSRYVEARVDQLLEVAPERVEPVCPYYADCGGCQLQHTHHENQLAIKQAAVFDQIEKGAGVKAKRYLPPIESPAFAYRRTARFSIDARNGEFKLGFRKRNSHELVDVDRCDLLVPELNNLLVPLKNLLANISQADAIGHLDLLAADAQAVIIRVLKPIAEKDIQLLKNFAQDHQCNLYLQLGKDNQLHDLDQNGIDPRLHYEINAAQLRLAFHPLDFIQVNDHVNQQMIQQALSLLKIQPEDRVLDLFCGIGNFTLPIAQKAKQVIGIEALDSMVQRAKENAAASGLYNCEFVAADLEKISLQRLKNLCGKLDAVLLDPPRDGAKTSISLLAQLSPKRVVYVSCNPATLARDAKQLLASGYKLDSLGVLDMFPQTSHIESMALFVRA